MKRWMILILPLVLMGCSKVFQHKTNDEFNFYLEDAHEADPFLMGLEYGQAI